MSNRIGNIALAILACCALLITGAVLKREFGRSTAAGDETVQDFRYTPRVTDSLWRTIATSGELRGSPHARDTIVVFSDYQCPGCRQFAAELTRLRGEFPDRIAVRTHYFPLEAIHPYARAAALASACAAAAGRFAAYDSLLFDRVSTFRAAPWVELAARAGIQDTTAFRRCLKGKESERILRADTTLGTRIPVRATPTVFVGHLAFSAPPNENTLRAILERAK